jgi:predicted O-methyltransferase YrrM
MSLNLPIDIESIKGFLSAAEGEALHKYALQASITRPCLEIGSYCGRSTVYLGLACKRHNSVLYSVDHHRGSEEHQLGEEYHDADLYDAREGIVDSFREFRRTLRRVDLEDHVIPIVTSSLVASRYWATPLGMVFIDGGHSLGAALTDYRCWVPAIVPGGILAIHDIFPDPAQGGQAPYTIWKMALASGLFDELPIIGTLGFLRRVDYGDVGE